MFDLSTLKTKHRNPRKIDKADLERLKKSVSEFQKMLPLRPIVYDPFTMEILGGNQRFTALKQLGYTLVAPDWVKSAEGMTEEEKRRFIITDNDLFGEWDLDILKVDFNFDELESWGLESVLGEIEVPPLQAVEDDFNPEINPISEDIIKVGDLFQIGDHRLICGDSTKFETFQQLFQDELAAMVNTDPPYNVNYEGGTKEKLTIMNDKMDSGAFYLFLHDFYSAQNQFVKKGGAWYIWHADSEGATFRTALQGTGILFKQVLIWVKNQFTLGRQDYQWKHEPCILGINDDELKIYDPCLYGWREGDSHKWYSDRKQSTVLEFKKPLANKEHPTMKPVELIGYQISNSSKEGDIVADGFAGSGTALVACEQLKRRCYAVEFDPKYIRVILIRMKLLVPDIVILKNGEPFDIDSLNSQKAY